LSHAASESRQSCKDNVLDCESAGFIADLIWKRWRLILENVTTVKSYLSASLKAWDFDPCRDQAETRTKLSVNTSTQASQIKWEKDDKTFTRAGTSLMLMWRSKWEPGQ
jgi:hypothetical protein